MCGRVSKISRCALLGETHTRSILVCRINNAASVKTARASPASAITTFIQECINYARATVEYVRVGVTCDESDII